MKSATVSGIRLSRLGLGTAQFGEDYGFSKSKQSEECGRILSVCGEIGINWVDTAREYGDSEYKIGAFVSAGNKGLVIATKLAALPAGCVNADDILAHIERSAAASREALKTGQIDLLQLHQESEPLLRNPQFWKAVREARERGIFKGFGVSLYDPTYVPVVLSNDQGQTDMVQAPYNLLNRSFGTQTRLLKERGVAFIARSVFLKGAISIKEERLPDFLTPLCEWRRSIHDLAQTQGLTLAELSLLFAYESSDVDAVLIGVDNEAQLHANFAAIGKSAVYQRIREEVLKLGALVDQNLVDPRRWPAKRWSHDRGTAKRAAKNLAILQARTSSTRLPGKVLKPILDEPMMLRQIERVRRAKLIDVLLVATSTDASDDPICELCTKHNIPFFRGSLNDVLSRFYEAAKPYNPDCVVRLTADCPLADPSVIDRVIAAQTGGDNDYTSNTTQRTYPDGLDAEAFKFSALEAAYREAAEVYDREHVTSFLYHHPDRFKIGVVKSPENISGMRWTVDTSEDFEFVKRVYEALYLQKPSFGTEDILQYLKKTPQTQAGGKH